MSTFVTGEVLLFDANGVPLVLTAAGEMKAEVFQKANTQFEQVIVDPSVPTRKAEVTADGRLTVETHAPVGQAGQHVIIVDPITGNQASVDETGALNVVQNLVIVPDDKTSWNQNTQEVTGDRGGTDSWDIIVPNNETLTLKQWSAGAYVLDDQIMLQWKANLWWQPNGSTSGQELLEAFYFQGQSEGVRNFEREFTGDGTARFHVDIVNQSRDDSEARLFLKGYY